MNNKVVLIVVAVVLVVAAFVAGGYVGPKFLPGASTSAGRFAGGPGGNGGPMANLSEEDRAKVEKMSDEERREYFQQQMGANGGPGGQGGQSGQGGPGRMGGGIEGEVLSVASDQITVKTTDGGSQNVYIDGDTVVAFAKGVTEHELATGDTVIVVAQPETDGVMSATAVVVK